MTARRLVLRVALESTLLVGKNVRIVRQGSTAPARRMIAMLVLKDRLHRQEAIAVQHAPRVGMPLHA